MRLFLTGSTQHLYRAITKSRHDIGRYDSYTFADGERGYRLTGEAKGRKVAIIGSVLPQPDSLFELLSLLHLVRENGARETILIIPYLGYARQDRPCRKGEGSIGIMVTQLIRNLNPARLILFDVHSEIIRKQFGPEMAELSGLPLFARAFTKKPPDVIVSPDAGSVSRAKSLAELLTPRPEVARIDKVRPHPNVAVARRIHGEVRGKMALIIDDMIDTGGTIAEAVKLVSQSGASSIHIAATHGIFSRDARSRLSTLPVETILVTNTLPQVRFPKIRVLDISPLLLNAL